MVDGFVTHFSSLTLRNIKLILLLVLVLSMDYQVCLPRAAAASVMHCHASSSVAFPGPR